MDLPALTIIPEEGCVHGGTRIEDWCVEGSGEGLALSDWCVEAA